jgi:hypothetical protein
VPGDWTANESGKIWGRSLEHLRCFISRRPALASTQDGRKVLFVLREGKSLA